MNADLKSFNRAIDEAMLVTRKTLAEQINQSAFNVAARGMRNTTISDQNKIRSYLGQVMVSGRDVQGFRYTAAAKLGTPSAGMFGSRRKRSSRQLRRVLLIAQKVFYQKHGYGIGKGKSNKRTKRLRQLSAQQLSAFDKNGKLKATREVNQSSTILAARADKVVIGSDYGDAMMRYVGKMFNRAIRSYGYLAAVFVPALRLFGPNAKFKGLASRLPYRVLWSQGSAFGSATLATDGNTRARFTGLLTAKRMTAAGQAIIDKATSQAFADEEKELRRHTEEQLQKAFQKLTR